MPTPRPDDLYGLSASGRRRLRRYAAAHACGLSYKAIAEQLGETRSHVRLQMAALRKELEQVALDEASSADISD